MHIIIDARMIIERIHGIARILLENFQVWENLDIDHKITLLTNKPHVLEEFNLLRRFDYAEVKSRPFEPAEIIEIPKVLKKIGGDLYHAPSISVPPFKVMNTVITVPDLYHFHYGNMVEKLYCNTVLRMGLNHATEVIAISDFVRKDVSRAFGIRRDRITVIHLAAPPSVGVSVLWDDLRKKYEIRSPFLFCMGNPKPHKNIVGAINVFNRIKKTWTQDLMLVIGSGSSPRIESAINSSPYKEDIIRKDYFPEEELEMLFTQAQVFIYPSLFEGFGLPPLEAMKFGCPVVSSNRASLSEAVGEGGILVDPENIETFAQAVLSLLANEEKRREWSLKALQWQEQFSWEKSAMQTLQVYERAVKAE